MDKEKIIDRIIKEGQSFEDKVLGVLSYNYFVYDGAISEWNTLDAADKEELNKYIRKNF